MPTWAVYSIRVQIQLLWGVLVLLMKMTGCCVPVVQSMPSGSTHSVFEVSIIQGQITYKLHIDSIGTSFSLISDSSGSLRYYFEVAGPQLYHLRTSNAGYWDCRYEFPRVVPEASSTWSTWEFIACDGFTGFRCAGTQKMLSWNSEYLVTFVDSSSLGVSKSFQVTAIEFTNLDANCQFPRSANYCAGCKSPGFYNKVTTIPQTLTSSTCEVIDDSAVNAPNAATVDSTGKEITCLPGFRLTASGCLLMCLDPRATLDGCDSPTSSTICNENFLPVDGVCRPTPVCTDPLCGVCQYGNICAECLPNHGFDAVLGDCQPFSPVANCLLLTDNGVCGVCEEGFRLDNSVCLAFYCLDPNCESCDSPGRCHRCAMGFETAADGRCWQLPCNENCVTCDDVEEVCTSCAENFELKEGRCRPQICEYPCQTCFPDPRSCISCRPGFSLSGFHCFETPNNCDSSERLLLGGCWVSVNVDPSLLCPDPPSFVVCAVGADGACELQRCPQAALGSPVCVRVEELEADVCASGADLQNFTFDSLPLNHSIQK